MQEVAHLESFVLQWQLFNKFKQLKVFLKVAKGVATDVHRRH